jgi:hypothetical protein
MLPRRTEHGYRKESEGESKAEDGAGAKAGHAVVSSVMMLASVVAFYDDKIREIHIEPSV